MINLKEKLLILFKKRLVRIICLLSIFLLAFLVRILYLKDYALSFSYDQARDAFVVLDILKGDWKILGPSVSGVPGLYHGVLYYYVIAPAYFFGNGDPIAAAYIMSFISSIGVLIVYYLAFLLTKEFVPGLLAAFIFAFSFEATQYSNLLTNASMGMWFVPIIYIGLYLWVNKQTRFGPLITGLGLGLSIQSEIALAYHIVPILGWTMYFRNRINRHEIITSLLSFTVSVFSMVLSEIKFGMTGLSGVIYLFASKDGIVQGKQLSDYVVTSLDQLGKTFAYNIFPINVVFGGVLGFLIIIIALRGNSFWSKFLASYIFAFMIALPFGGWNMRHLLVGVAPAMSVFVGIFLWRYLNKNIFMIFAAVMLIMGTNLFKIIDENINGQTLFITKDMTLAKEVQVVDYAYNNSDDGTFSISTLTNPLFVNTVWSYLFNQYGKTKYGYLPSWIGRDQVGQMGDNLIKVDKITNKHFFIIEPTYGIPELWVNYAKGDQNSFSLEVEQKEFGSLIVQKRISKK